MYDLRVFYESDLPANNVTSLLTCPPPPCHQVMKVDTEERPTRYYVHFTDTSHRHDRWVTRDEISRVYRAQLRPIQTVESPMVPTAHTPAGREKGRSRSVGEEQQVGTGNCLCGYHFD